MDASHVDSASITGKNSSSAPDNASVPPQNVDNERRESGESGSVASGPPAEAGRGVAPARPRRTPRVADDPGQLAAYLRQQCLDMNCPCGGDRRNHDVAVTDSQVQHDQYRLGIFGRAWDQAVEELAAAQIAERKAAERYREAEYNLEVSRLDALAERQRRMFEMQQEIAAAKDELNVQRRKREAS